MPAVIRRGTEGRKRDGLALVAVLWLVAALSITVTGVVHAVRGEVRAVAFSRDVRVAGALAEGGIVLAASELAAARARDAALRRFETTIEGRTVHIVAIPLSGLIDLNAASEQLLTDLFAVAGGVERAVATTLAQRVLDWRDPDEQPRPSGAENAAYAAARSPFRTRGGPFEAPEDLLQVLGVDFDLYVKLRRFVTVHQRGSGRVSPVSAPLPVLRILARGNAQLAIAYARARAASGGLADSSRFPSAYVAQMASSRFLLEASVQISSGASLVSRQVVDVASEREGVPWTVLWSERGVEPAEQG
jgi:general secretion pathway protein K